MWIKTFLAMNCYWCATEVYPFGSVAQTHPKLATTDHIRSKPECVSAREYNHRQNKVTACYACNQKRSAEWCARERAGLVHRTPWSVRQSNKLARRRERKKRDAEEREYLKNCVPCPTVYVKIAPELGAAWE